MNSISLKKRNNKRLILLTRREKYVKYSIIPFGRCIRNTRFYETALTHFFYMKVFKCTYNFPKLKTCPKKRISVKTYSVDKLCKLAIWHTCTRFTRNLCSSKWTVGSLWAGKSSVPLVLAGHISRAWISWLSADPRLPVGIPCLSRHPYIRSIQYSLA